MEISQQGEKYRRGAPVLSSRLRAAAALVRQGSPAADIGCDHGKLAVWLAVNRRCPRVVAVDNRPLPLERAKALVAQAGCEAVVDCRLGDGLGPVSAGEVRDIVIAGMSGETIVEILSPATWLRDPAFALVLLPVTRDVPLRKYLLDQGFSLEEHFVEDTGRPYLIMRAVHTGTPAVYDETFLCFGAAIGGGEAARTFVRRRLRDLYNRREAPLGTEERAKLERLIAEGEKCCK